MPVPNAAHSGSVRSHQCDTPPLVCREVSGDVGGGTSSDEESVTPSSGSESDDDDASESDSESWGKVRL